MFGFGKNGGLKQAEENLKKEFGLALNGMPAKNTIVELFEKINKQGQLSPEAQTALLYRIVVLMFLSAAKLMRDSGEKTFEHSFLIDLTQIINRSVDWSENAPDHVTLEQLTSHININSQKLFESLGIHRGAKT